MVAPSITLLLFSILFISKLLASQYGVMTDPGNCCKRLDNSTVSRPCKSTRLKANEFQQIITTPDYPEPFDPDVFCKWEIFARPGRRILIDIRNLNLAAKEQNECRLQKLVITSPLTGLSMGSFCGHDGTPNIVTTGNYVVVELLSPYPVGSNQYKGFQMVYAETVQATSVPLRPTDWSDSMYLEYQTTPRNRRPPRITTNRDPVNVNKNTNRDSKPTVKTVHNTRAPTFPKRKPPKEKDRVRSNGIKPRDTPPGYFNPPFRIPTRIDTNSDEQGMETAAIVGLVCGGVIVLTLVAVVVTKLRKSQRSDRGMKEAEETTNAPDHLKLDNIASYSHVYSQKLSRTHGNNIAANQNPKLSTSGAINNYRNDRSNPKTQPTQKFHNPAKIPRPKPSEKREKVRPSSKRRHETDTRERKSRSPSRGRSRTDKTHRASSNAETSRQHQKPKQYRLPGVNTGRP